MNLIETLRNINILSICYNDDKKSTKLDYDCSLIANVNIDPYSKIKTYKVNDDFLILRNEQEYVFITYQE